jgi:hypothetical protein
LCLREYLLLAGLATARSARFHRPVGWSHGNPIKTTELLMPRSSCGKRRPAIGAPGNI